MSFRPDSVRIAGSRYCRLLRRITPASLLAIALLLGAGAARAGAESEVEIDGLSGTLTVPTSPGKAIAILIAGSGPTDRDGNNPYGLSTDAYRKIAQALDAAGVASLRYDKRGIARSAGLVKSEDSLRIEHFADDVVRLAAWARDKRGFADVFLVGHGEGGLLALMAAERANPRGLVLLASPGRPMGVLLREQFSQPAVPETFRAQALALLSALERDGTVSDVAPELQGMFRPSIQGFMRSLIKVDPARLLARSPAPVLIIGGSKDLQTTRADFDALRDARSGQRDPARAPAGAATTSLWIDEMTHALKLQPPGAQPQRTYVDPNLALAPPLMPTIMEFLAKTSAAPPPPAAPSAVR